MKAVNLLPADRRQHKGRFAKGPGTGQLLLLAAGAAALVCIAGIGFAVHTLDSNVSTKQSKLDALKAQIAATPAPVTTSGSALTSVAGRLTAVQTVVGQRLSWDGFFGALSRVIPEDVWLLSIQAASASAASATTPTTAATTPGATPTAFTITGYTYSQPSVARMMKRLALVPWLSDVTLVTSTKTLIGTHNIYQFTIGANIVSLSEVGS